jgi:hypothetical protein
MTSLRLESFQAQSARWPVTGRHVLAQYDDDAVVVYQAYKPSIGRFAAENGHFRGGGFSLSRMSWIKPNFLWMMFRCGWATKVDQEVVLAVSLERTFFEDLLARAVHSSFSAESYASHDEWTQRLARSEVRLQWDPDHGPRGGKLERRAIQLGLRGESLRRSGSTAICGIEDISDLVAEGRARLESGGELRLPRERPLIPRDPAVVRHLGLDRVAPA